MDPLTERSPANSAKGADPPTAASAVLRSIDSRSIWSLARHQHGVVALWQLTELGMSARAVKHRIERGRLHRVLRGVYAVGRPRLSRHGRWMAAVLACGPNSVLSDGSAAALWGFGVDPDGAIEVSVRSKAPTRVTGVRVHRRAKLLDADLTVRHWIPLTAPVRTLIDMAAKAGPDSIERMVGEADRLDLVDPETLRAELGRFRGQRGVGRLRAVLGHRTFRTTRSGLERRFLRLAEGAGLPVPLTGQWVNGFEVDFYWPDLGLIVETDGARYHRMPAKQTRDRRRDQAHTAAGLTQLRFTEAQIVYDGPHVVRILRAVGRRLQAAATARRMA